MNTPDKTGKTIPLIAAIVIFCLWMAPGLVGRDLWKADEPYSFGLIYHIVQTGDWVLPTLAGTPFVEKPPLFYITAAVLARLFSPLLPLHDAARLACAFYMSLTMLFIGLAAKELFGRNAVGLALIALIGSAGLQGTSHKLITDTAMLTGLALSMYGLALCRRRSVLGGILIGTGAGIGFMTKGLLAPGFVAVVAVALPLFFPQWRKKSYMTSLAVSCIAVLPWVIIWPLALYLRSPGDFVEWFWYQNMGRFLGYSHVGRRFAWTYYFINLPWFALPTLPIALWIMWHTRGTWRSNESMQIPLTTFLVMFVILSLSSSIRNIYALPMLLPLALLAAAGSESFPERAKAVINRIGTWLFACAAFILWVGWIVMVSGMPASLANKMYQYQPDYLPAFHGLPLVVACVYTVAWMFVVFRTVPCAHQYMLNWTAGIVLTWGLLMTLWLPWFDAGSGYRAMFESLQGKIPATHSVILMQGLGESERALLQYYAGVIPRTMGDKKAAECDLLLIQSGSDPDAPPAGYDWELLWEWQRPSRPVGKPKEIFRLMQRKGVQGTCR